ncbi:MAG: hypothetical protein IT168_03705 [Bryobacterales bacterium]|nr:hypothetical protein [Bryobacterales bacterium]
MLKVSSAHRVLLPGGILCLLMMPVAASAVELGASPTQIIFIQPANAQAPRAQTLSITAGGAVLPFQVSTSGASWLSVSSPTAAITPAILNVSVNIAGLSAGNYQGFIQITAVGAANSPISVPVTLQVSTTPQASVSAAQLAFEYDTAGTAPPSQALYIYSAPGSFSATASTTSGSWLTIATGPNTPAPSLIVSVTPVNLPAGVYQGFITIYFTGNPVPVVVGVSLRVLSSASLWTSTGPLTFRYRIGDAVPPKQQLTVSYYTFTGFSVQANSSGWLAVDTDSGFAPAVLNVSVNPSGLAPGTYRGTILLQAGIDWSTLTVPVTLEVSGSLPISVDATTLTFQTAAGVPPAPQTVKVNASGATNFTAKVASGSWISVSPTTGQTPSNVTVNINPAGLAPGSYQGSVVFLSEGSKIAGALVSVKLTVTGTATVSATPTSLRFDAASSSAKPPSQTVSVTSNFNIPIAVAVTGGGWLEAAPVNGTTPVTVTVSVNPAGLAIGSYSGTVTLTAPGSTLAPLTIPVALNIAAGQPTIRELSNGNGLARDFAPGSMLTIYGGTLGPNEPQVARLTSGNPVPTNLGGTRVLINNTAVPLLYVQATQINAIVPYALAGQRVADLQVEVNGILSDRTPIELSDTAPVLFTLNGSGRGQGAFINQSGGLNNPASPADRGSVLVLYGSGGGVADLTAAEENLVPTQARGLRNQVTVWIGGVQADVDYAGVVPGMPPGMIQINVRVPAEAPVGEAVPVSVRAGGNFSQAGVTAAIK